jgi:penicillin-binding protein 1C
MQVARLLGEMPTRSTLAKVKQIRLALALERRLTKVEILNLYLTLAPFGGNLEGVRAASLAWFGKEPRRLTPAEAALLVALPQSPEARRPDRYKDRATTARNRVLARAVGKGVLSSEEATAAHSESVPSRRRAFPALAPHLTKRLYADSRDATLHLTLNRDIQSALETLVRERIATLPQSASIAIMVADRTTGEVLAHIGSPGLDQTRRGGFLDMTSATRSPGSTLKSLIYGLAFEQGIAHPETLIQDRPTSFGRYTPVNFDGRYHGTLRVREALQRSLNIPAIALLDGIGPAKLMSRMRRIGSTATLPPGRTPGLAIGLGGLGMTLTDLLQIYVGIANGGKAMRLRYQQADPEGNIRLLSPKAAWHVVDVLAGTPPPRGAQGGKIAYKTGTSYGHRDAWSVGFDGQHVIGIWVGRPDAAPIPGITGRKTAAPLLFEAFTRLKPEAAPLPTPPADTLVVSHADLPQPLKQFRGTGQRIERDGPEIIFPPDGARVSLNHGEPLALKIRDGRPPFTWIVNGTPVATRSLERETLWHPTGPGYLSISVVDRLGLSAQAQVRLE